MKWSLFADTSNLPMKSFFRKTAKNPQRGILPLDKQVKAWRKANRKMNWGIGHVEFEAIGLEPALSPADHRDGFSGVILSYGFGDDGHGNSDTKLSSRCAWDFAVKRRKPKTLAMRIHRFRTQRAFSSSTGRTTETQRLLLLQIPTRGPVSVFNSCQVSENG